MKFKGDPHFKPLETRKAEEVSRPDERRNPFDLDRTRILHSAAFRRLQGKTQVLGVGESDFLRTRLTHSIEVANVGRGLLQSLQANYKGEAFRALPCQDLVEAISFAHDLGHPPFGHNGEKALNACMLGFGGFEGNGHTLRLLASLESRVSGYGLNLTRRTLLGILKYPLTYSELVLKAKKHKISFKDSPPKCYLDSEKEVVGWALEPFSANDIKRFLQTKVVKKDDKTIINTVFKTLDCSIMDVADEISYGVHDLEDGIQIGMIERRHVEMPRSVDGQTVRGLVEIFSSEWGRRWGLQNAVDELFSSNPDKKAFRKTAIGGIVHALIGSILIKSDEKFDHPILRYNAVLSEEAKLVVKYINKVAMSEVVGRQAVQTLEYRGRVLVEGIFKAMSNFPDRLLPKDYFEKYDLAKIKKDKMRVICDYVAGMTDSYATRIYERLYIPRTGNVFEKL